MTEHIKIFDTTLRDGEQSVDTLEAGFPAASDGDFEAVSEIAKKLKRTEVAALSRTSVGDIDRAWGAIRHRPGLGGHPTCGQTENPHLHRHIGHPPGVQAQDEP